MQSVYKKLREHFQVATNPFEKHKLKTTQLFVHIPFRFQQVSIKTISYEPWKETRKKKSQ